jgi:hypothetical protein
LGEAAGEPEVKDEPEERKEHSVLASRLRDEARSAKHHLTHVPKNPFCEACQRGKMREKYSRRGAFKHTLEKWGEIITLDYLYSGSCRTVGLGAERECFVIKDMFTGILHGFPTESRSAMCVGDCIKFFTGRRKIQQIYSDNAPEFLKAVKMLGIVHETSAPGVPQTNGIIERSNQLLIGGTVTSLIAAGLPPCDWSYAAPCWCFNYNIERIKDSINWERLRNEPFHGDRFPFGCQVIFKPSETRKLSDGVKHEKWDPKGRVGIFAGYKLHPGYDWKGEYLVWDRASFQHSDLRSVATHLHQRVGKPYVTRLCTLPEVGITFPLKEHYEKVNADIFDPRITNDEFEPHEEARKARAPSFLDPETSTYRRRWRSRSRRRSRA